MSDDMFPFEVSTYYCPYDIDVMLAVAATGRGEVKFLIVESPSGDLTLPIKPLHRETNSATVAEQIFKEYFRFDPSAWANIKQAGFVDVKGGKQIVLYATYLQDYAPLYMSNARWMTFNEIFEGQPSLLELFGRMTQ